ncbi:hypothetical protein FOS14_15010 [Skermania sp. ID1734]|uniref:SRPBCC family protein n=1 Tax=Skermania sp. ID1734 TaxID=2597516 RepID=UPI00117E9C0A|nr:SRPBCC family protein [Skermania sp. ID1734]TSD97290.1 hypothetical protein FOS14_15010 [Skermania sp. ID1734]
MTTIASAQITSTAPAAAFFEKWADMATWPEWNSDTEWVRLDGPFESGATGRLKPKGAPAVKFTVAQLVPGERFVDVSRLILADLTFDHRVTSVPEGVEITVKVRITGPLGWLWKRLMGAGIAATLGADLQNLAAAAERVEVRR